MRQERSWSGPYQLRNNLWSRLYSRFIEARRLDALTPSWPSGLPIPPQSWLRQLPATILRTPKDSRRVSGSLTLRCSISRKAGWLLRKLADFLGTSGLMHHWKEPWEGNIQRRTSFGPCSLALDGWRTMLFNDALRWVLGQVVSPNQVSSVIERHPRFSMKGCIYCIVSSHIGFYMRRQGSLMRLKSTVHCALSLTDGQRKTLMWLRGETKLKANESQIWQSGFPTKSQGKKRVMNRT